MRSLNGELRGNHKRGGGWKDGKNQRLRTPIDRLCPLDMTEKKCTHELSSIWLLEKTSTMTCHLTWQCEQGKFHMVSALSQDY